jgi:hypothetical protein
VHSQRNAGDEGGGHGSLKAKEREPRLRNPHVHDLTCLTSLDGLDPPALHPTALEPPQYVRALAMGEEGSESEQR